MASGTWNFMGRGSIDGAGARLVHSSPRTQFQIEVAARAKRVPQQLWVGTFVFDTHLISSTEERLGSSWQSPGAVVPYFADVATPAPNSARPPHCLHCGSPLHPKASQDGHPQTQKPGVIPVERGQATWVLMHSVDMYAHLCIY